MLLAALLGAAATTAGIALTATSGWLVVRASEQPAVLTLLTAVVAVRAFGLARPVLRYAERLRSHDISLRRLAARRVQAYERLVPLTPARLGRRRRADVLSGVVDDLTDVVESQVRVQVPVASAFTAGVLTAALTALVAPPAGLTLALLLAAVALIAVVGRRWESAAQAESLRARADVLRVSELVVADGAALRAAEGAPVAVDWADAAATAARTASRRQSRGRATTAAAVLGLVAVAVAVVAAQVQTLDLTLPVKGLLALTPVAAVEAFQPLVDAVRAAARVRAARNRIDAVLDEEPAVQERRHTRALPSGHAVTIRLRAVEGRWTPSGPVIGPVDLTIAPGAHVLVTGPNGSGKSTLLALLGRQLDPVVGEYLLDGVDVRELGVEDVRSRFAVVDDEPHVFSTSVRENLRVACSETPTDRQIEEALARAGLGEWLAHLPDGLATRLGAGGRAVSGGERSRLAIARALLSGRPVILLDEPLAHLDHPTATSVLAALMDAPGRPSLVVVSHAGVDPGHFDEVVELAVRPRGRSTAGDTAAGTNVPARPRGAAV